MELEKPLSVGLRTPSKLNLRRMNSAFKAHVSVQKVNQCKPLTIAKSTTHNIPYLPKKDKDSLVFYGTQKFYVFLRFFYTLYERVLKAYELCHVIEENEITS